MAHFDEQQVLEQIRQGDRAAMGQLLSHHEGRLYNIALRMLRRPADAADVTQEALMRVIQHIDSFRSQAQISTWMTRIVMNQAISLLRKRKRRESLSLDASPGSYGASGDQAPLLREQLANIREPGPAQRVQDDEMVQVMLQALDRLEDDFKAVLVMRDLEEMSYQQIAEVLEVKMGTVKSRLFRARLALRQEMRTFVGHQPRNSVQGPTPN